MSIRPRFRSCYRVEIIPSEAVVLLSEHGDAILTDPVERLLAPLLAGPTVLTMEELVEALSGQVAPQQIMVSLLRLRQRGYVTNASSQAPVGAAALWDMLDVSESSVAERLAQRRVSVETLGPVDPQPLRDMLEALGVQVGDDGDRRVVVVDDYLCEQLDAYNARALEERRPWMLVKPVGRSLWLGPIFVPDKTGCWQCLAHRLRGHRKPENYLRQQEHGRGRDDDPSSSRAGLPTTIATGLNMAATEIYRWIVEGEASRLEGRVLTMDALTLASSSHRLVRRSQCPACGSGGEVSVPVPSLELQSRPKGFTADGGHRSVSPQVAFERLAHHVSPVTGIIASLHPAESIESSAELTPAYIADYAYPGAICDLRGLLDVLHRRAGGKGQSREQARMSAMGEAIERYCGVFQGDEPRVRKTMAELGDAAVHPNACMNFSERQIADRETINRRRHNSTWVAASFDETAPVDWTPVYSLTHDATRYLPTAYCYYGYSERHGVEFARANSNGCAAGSNKEEAIVQGFMEVVERDGVALWWYNRIPRPGVDLNDFDEPYVHTIRAYLASIHRELWVLDVTSDVEIPIFAAISRRIDKPAEDIIFGFGAHLCPRTALTRALTELMQSLPPVASVVGDEGYRGANAYAIEWWKTATLDEHPHLCPDPSQPPRGRAAYPDRAGDDLRDDVWTCVRSVQARGLETLILDQTRADVGLDVVKVIVPGMRHFWPRLGPGRLFDVPVRMGWLPTPRREDELNSTFVYF